MPTRDVMFTEGVRMFVVVLATALGYWEARNLGWSPTGQGAMGAVACLLGYVAGGLLGRGLDHTLGVVEERAGALPPARVVASTLGAVGGGVAGILLAAPLVVALPPRIGVPLGGLVVWITLWAGVRVVGRHSESVLEMMGLSSRPLVRAHAYDARDGVLVDTSVLMDGQLRVLTRSGLVTGDVLVAPCVLDELQGFADNLDDPRSRHARAALELLDVVRTDGDVRVFVLDDEVPEVADVDAKLVAIARRLELRLLTNDEPLARIAALSGVPAINVRRLVADLAPALVAGDVLEVAVDRVGKDPGQGVGTLPDGSMCVVNGGAGLVGRTAQVVVRNVVASARGRIVFATPHDDARMAG